MSETEDIKRRAERLAYVKAREVQLREELAALNAQYAAAGDPSKITGNRKDRKTASSMRRAVKLSKAEKHKELSRLAREKHGLRLTPEEQVFLLETQARENVHRWIEDL